MAIVSKPMIDRGAVTRHPERTERTGLPERLDAERLNLEAVRFAESGKLEQAVAVLERALLFDPTSWTAHNNLGIALARLRRFDGAVLSFRQAIALRPSSSQAHNNLANVLAEQGRNVEAVDEFEQALRLDPDYPDARFNLAKVLVRLGRFGEAEDVLRRALRTQSGVAKIHRQLGITLAAQGMVDEAISRLRAAIDLDNDDPENHFELGRVLRDARRLDEAIACFKRATRLRPGYLDALNALGICLTHEGHPERAIACFHQATESCGESATILCNHGIALAACGQFEEALALYHRALEIRPDHTEVHNNAATALVGLHRYVEAIAGYGRALSVNPNYADAHRNRALIRLLLGDLQRGWPEYEWRWKCQDFQVPRFSQPKWDGGPLDGKTILLYAEQGLGDTLQFVRYASLVKARGATVLLRAPEALVSLLGRCEGIDLVVSGDAITAFDVHLPLLSLPSVFGTTLDNVPARAPYLFADPQLVELWRNELAPLRANGREYGGRRKKHPNVEPVKHRSVTRPRAHRVAADGRADVETSLLLVGIAWQGNPRYPCDRLRSIPLESFAPLASVPGVRLINLQKGHGTDQLLGVAGQFSVSEPPGDVDGGHGRFMDTAAIMKNLDLVVTSDTALAHLAGGLGVPVWVAIPYAPDWRWLLDREDSPWYPTMRLFRQPSPGDWEAVFRTMRRELRSLVRQGAEFRDQSESYVAPLSSLIEDGVQLADSGKLREALAKFQQAAWVEPRSVDAHNNRGIVLNRLSRFEEAVASFRRCLRLAPHDVAARVNLGVALADLGQPELAEKELRQAIRLSSRAAETHYSLGNVLASQAKWQPALDCFRQALRFQPEFARAHVGAGNVYRQQRRFDDALAAYDRALALSPRLNEAQRQRATTRLLLGDFERGWPDFAESHSLSRPRLTVFQSKDAAFGNEAKRRVEGTDLRALSTKEESSKWIAGKRLLLFAGRNLAETLILLRFAYLAQERGAYISVVCRVDQQPIVRACRGVDLAIVDPHRVPVSDFQGPLACLPGLLDSPGPECAGGLPFLELDGHVVDRWRTQFSALEGLKIGVAWHGDAREGAVPNEWIEALAQMPGVQLVRLGKVTGRHAAKPEVDGPRMAYTPGGAVVPTVTSSTDLAAVVSNLDLVIATDGACAHLAGALGVPLFVALPVLPEWYWLLGRDDTPWYPGAKLFRQHRAGDWGNVCQRIDTQLRRWLDGQDGDERGREESDRLCAEGAGRVERGELDQALDSFRRATEMAPSYAVAYNNLGSGYARLGRHRDAESAYRMAVKRRPFYPEAHVNLGLALAGMGEAEEAVRCFRSAVRQRPEWARAHFYLGNGLATLGSWHAALGSYREAGRLDRADEDVQLNMGVALREVGRLEESAATLERTLRSRPDHVNVLNNLAVTYCRLNRFWQSLECLQRALQLRPDFSAAHNNLGITLAQLGRYSEAIDAYRRALAVCPSYAEAHSNLGIALTMEARYHEALDSFHMAIELRPDYPEAHNNRGIALKELGRHDEAIATYERALALDPDYADAHLNRALAWLGQGDWPSGWPEYEWRHQQRPRGEKRFAQPLWQGEPLEDRTLLIHCEQGLGDTLQFIRYVALAKQRAKRIVVRCPKRLVNLLHCLSDIDQLVSEDGPLPQFDCHAPLLSLPRIFGTTLQTVPAHVPYLSADPELVEHWRRQLQRKRGTDALRVGVNWQGNTHYQGDRHRSFSLSRFAPLAAVEGVHLISLQQGIGREQLEKVYESGFTVDDLGPDVDESRGAFVDTAAVMMNLDLVVTSDTAVAHLAGALGRTVWVALPFSADWRWLVQRDDSPWYPTMRLYRQPSRDDWPAVFDRIRVDLTQLVKIDPPGAANKREGD